MHPELIVSGLSGSFIMKQVLMSKYHKVNVRCEKCVQKETPDKIAYEQLDKQTRSMLTMGYSEKSNFPSKYT